MCYPCPRTFVTYVSGLYIKPGMTLVAESGKLLLLMTATRMRQTFKVLCPPGSDASADVFLDDFYHTLPLSFVWGVRVLYWLFYWGPWVVMRRPRSVIHLSPEETERYLEWWSDHRFHFMRETFSIVKTVALLARVGKDWDPKS